MTTQGQSIRKLDPILNQIGLKVGKANRASFVHYSFTSTVKQKNNKKAEKEIGEVFITKTKDNYTYIVKNFTTSNITIGRK
jgi:hypothetical protein